MTTGQAPSGEVGPRFSSIEDMQQAHRNLLTLARTGELRRDAVLEILQKGRDVGTLLDLVADRVEAQSILDYWSARLYSRALRDPDGGAVAPEAALAEFDGAAVAAVAKKADAAMQGLDPRRRKTARLVLLQLVRIAPAPRRFAAQPVSGEELASLDDPRRVAEALATLQEAGALSPAPGADGAPGFRLRYESLVREWDQLREWLDPRWRFRAASRYGGQLTAARLREADQYHDLEDGEKAFLKRRKSEMRTRRRWLSALAVIVLAALVLQAVMSYRHAKASRELALIASDPDPAPDGSPLRAAIAAYEDAPTEEAERALHGVIAASIRIWTAPLSQRPGGVSISADGRRLATVQTDGSVRILDTASGKQLGRLLSSPPPGRTWTWEVAFGRTRLATITAREGTNEIDVWDPGSRTAKRVTTRDDVSMMSFSADEKVLAVASASPDIELWDIASGGKQVLHTGFPGAVETLGFSPDGKCLVVSGDGGELSVWDILMHTWRRLLPREGKEQERQERAAPVTALAFGPPDQLVTASADGVTLWSLARGGPIRPLPRSAATCSPAPRSFAYSADGRYLATAEPCGSVRVWETATGVQVASIRMSPSTIERAAFTPQDDLLLVAYHDRTRSASAALWNIAASSTLVLRDEGRPGDLHAGFKTERSLVAGNGLKLWEVSWERGAPAPRAVEAPSPCSHFWSDTVKVAFSADGSRVACAGSDADPIGGMVEVWLTRSPVPQRLLRRPATSVALIELSADGSRLAVVRWKSKAAMVGELWEVDGGQRLAVLPESSAEINSIAFAPSNGSVAVAKADGRFEVWDLDGLYGSDTPPVPPLRFAHKLDRAVYAVAYNPARAQIATAGDDGQVRLWDPGGGPMRTKMELHQENVRALAFSSNGSRLASADTSGQVRLWDATEGRAILLIPGNGDPYTGIEFSRDGALLAMTTADDLVQLEVLDLGWLAEIARQRLEQADQRRAGGGSSSF